MKVNEQLDKRREQLNKILTEVSFYLHVTFIATVINTVAGCVGASRIFVPYSLTSVQCSFEYAWFLVEKGRLVPSALMFVLSVTIAAIFVTACFRMSANSGWATLLTVIMTVDGMLTVVLIISRLTPVFYALDLALHMFMIVQTIRAKRASYGLSVLPNEEYEGDPFEDFANK